MVPSQSLFDSMVALLAADTAGLANATANKVSLVVGSFVPALNLSLGSLTLASFTGSTALAAGTGTQQVFVDPISNLKCIQIKEPAGGWNWICTVTPDPSQTIYGWVLTNGAIDTLLAAGLLASPIPISLSGQGLSIPYLRLFFNNNSPF